MITISVPVELPQFLREAGFKYKKVYYTSIVIVVDRSLTPSHFSFYTLYTYYIKI